MSYDEAQLRQAVDKVFQTYDKDGSGSLDATEVTALINDALKHMGANRQATQDEVNKLISATDKNSDKKVSREELLQIFKAVANQK